jgi:hypothetical protein
MKHTPGPWEQDGLTIRADHRGIVAKCPTPQQNGTYDCHGNARLIAVAPDLLEALKTLADDHEFGATGTIRQDHLATARAIIAKVEGNVKVNS